MVFGLNLFPIKDLTVNASMRMNSNFYAGFAPSERDNPDHAGKDVVQLDDYSLLDVHLTYKMQIMGTNLMLGGHILNAADAMYTTYGEDQGFEDDGSNSLPKVFYGSGMQFRLSFKVNI